MVGKPESESRDLLKPELEEEKEKVPYDSKTSKEEVIKELDSENLDSILKEKVDSPSLGKEFTFIDGK